MAKTGTDKQTAYYARVCWKTVVFLFCTEVSMLLLPVYETVHS
jgi:hypothetical protein